jgi:lipopolysaccharide transport system permease protein
VFRVGFLGAGSINMWGLLYTVVFAVVVYVLGLFVFNRVEKSFMDTI